MMFRTLFAALVVFVPWAGQTLAHEFWIEPLEYQVESGEPLIADLKNGQNFEGISLAYFETRTARFDLVENDTSRPVTARMGDVPALEVGDVKDGLLVVVHQTKPSTLTYAKWDKFQAFADQKDFPGVRERHLARGLPEEKFTETYTRYVKALVGIGSAQGTDALSGMETEFLALANPYTDTLNGIFPAQLLYQGAPRVDAQVEVFDRAPDGLVSITLLRTDAVGKVSVPVQSGHEYMLDGVVLRDAPEGGKAVWETLWAAMTFAVP